MTIAIVILGIACATLITRNVMLHRELNEEIAKTMRFVGATEKVLDEVEDHVWRHYEEELADTIWEGDIFDEWYGAYGAIVCL